LSILVTGANGFVGTALLRRLQEVDLVADALVRTPTNLLTGIARNVFVSQISHDVDFSEALLGIKTVVHLVARVHCKNDSASKSVEAFNAVNVEMTLNLARQAAVAGVKRFVFISSVKVNGEITHAGQVFTETDSPSPQNPYGLSKYKAEQGLRKLSVDTGVEVVIIRPPLVYGSGAKANFSALMHAIKRSWVLPLGAVHNQRSLVAVDNLVDFIVTCIAHPQAANQTFMVSDGQDLSTTELVLAMAKAAGVPANLMPVPMWALQFLALLLGKRHAMQRLCGNLQVDISKARSLLGWLPRVSVQEGLRRTMCLQK
jgi:nucleoside-diphosphate-sugar epimerase